VTVGPYEDLVQFYMTNTMS